MDCRTPGFPVHCQLPELTQTPVHQVGDAIQPSHPLSSPFPPAFNLPTTRVFPNESVLRMRWPKYWSFSISPSSEYSGLTAFRMDWLDLLVVQGTLESLQEDLKRPNVQVLLLTLLMKIRSLSWITLLIKRTRCNSCWSLSSRFHFPSSPWNSQARHAQIPAGTRRHLPLLTLQTLPPTAAGCSLLNTTSIRPVQHAMFSFPGLWYM